MVLQAGDRAPIPPQALTPTRAPRYPSPGGGALLCACSINLNLPSRLNIGEDRHRQPKPLKIATRCYCSPGGNWRAHGAATAWRGGISRPRGCLHK